jgi:hypothetical protein
MRVAVWRDAVMDRLAEAFVPNLYIGMNSHASFA